MAWIFPYTLFSIVSYAAPQIPLRRRVPWDRTQDYWQSGALTTRPDIIQITHFIFRFLFWPIFKASCGGFGILGNLISIYIFSNKEKNRFVYKNSLYFLWGSVVFRWARSLLENFKSGRNKKVFFKVRTITITFTILLIYIIPQRAPLPYLNDS